VKLVWSSLEDDDDDDDDHGLFSLQPANAVDVAHPSFFARHILGQLRNIARFKAYSLCIGTVVKLAVRTAMLCFMHQSLMFSNQSSVGLPYNSSQLGLGPM